MSIILPFDGKLPKLGQSVYIAPNATLIGDIEIDDDASVWFGAVLRGDVGKIRVGARSNIQDLSMIHMTTGLTDTVIGEDVTVGHSVVLHGCTVGHRCLIGMGSLIMDDVEIGDDCVIAAGTLLTPRTVIPPRSLVRGRPGKVVREAKPEEIAMGILGARHYVEMARRYREG